MRRTLKFFRLIILVMLPCVFAVACGGGGSGGSDETDEPLTTVGITGGTVEDTRGASVVIPEGALSDSYDISIASYLNNASLPQGVAPMLEMRGAVKLEPSGLTFSRPVTLTVPVSEYMEPRTQFPLLYWNEADQVWEQTAFIATVADNGMSFSADITHFSKFGGGAIEDLIYGGTLEQFKNDFTAWFEKEFMQDKNPVAKKNECYQICGAKFDLSYKINDDEGGDYWFTGNIKDSNYTDAPLIMVSYDYDIVKQGLNSKVRITSIIHYKCAKPNLDVLAAETTLEEGEVTTVNALLQCSGIPLIGKNITFSHTGPGEINPANITTNTSGSAAATFTAGNADAVIKAFYLGCEYGDSNTLEVSVPITVSGNTRLNIFIESNTESGGMVMTTSGTVPLSLTTSGTNDTVVTGTGLLQVSGTANAGGACSGVVSGESYVAVTGTRDAASTYDLTLILTQNAVLTVTCPDGTVVDTPLMGSDAKEVVLSQSNGYLVTEQGADNGTTWVSEVSLDKP
jgi:hypothetical protein